MPGGRFVHVFQDYSLGFSCFGAKVENLSDKTLLFEGTLPCMSKIHVHSKDVTLFMKKNKITTTACSDVHSTLLFHIKRIWEDSISFKHEVTTKAEILSKMKLQKYI